MPGLAVGGRRLVCDSAGGWRDRVMAGRTCPGVQMISRGRRPRAKCQTARSGVLVGRWTLILVFISTMRAAILIRRSLRVSNWATRQDECLGISVRFIVTNLGHGNGRSLYQHLYCRRGQA